VDEVMTPQSMGGLARKQKLSPEERTAIASKAASARWKKRGEGKHSKLSRRGARTASAAPPLPRQARVFGVALSAAENRLARAIEERAAAANKLAMLNAEIPSLQRTIVALQSHQNPLPSVAAAPVDLSGISSWNPLPSPPPPPALRVQGGALNVNLGDEEDEDRFLHESPAAGGEWH